MQCRPTSRSEASKSKRTLEQFVVHMVPEALSPVPQAGTRSALSCPAACHAQPCEANHAIEDSNFGDKHDKLQTAVRIQSQTLKQVAVQAQHRCAEQGRYLGSLLSSSHNTALQCQQQWPAQLFQTVLLC